VSHRQILAFAIALTATLTSTSPTRADEVNSYAQVEPSLALVISKNGKGYATGTAFCVENDGKFGFLLTNKHVVGNDKNPAVILMSDPKSTLNAPVVRTAELDAVVLAIKTNCQAVRLSTQTPPVGTRVALAGFPAFQLSVFAKGLGLSPSFHAGTISSLLADGNMLEYDAFTDHGNSGSPLFDVNTGDVYGLVTAINVGQTGALQNNVAIGSTALQAFLENAHRDIVSALTAAGLSARSAVQQARSAPPVQQATEAPRQTIAAFLADTCPTAASVEKQADDAYHASDARSDDLYRNAAGFYADCASTMPSGPDRDVVVGASLDNRLMSVPLVGSPDYDQTDAVGTLRTIIDADTKLINSTQDAQLRTHLIGQRDHATAMLRAIEQTSP